MNKRAISVTLSPDSIAWLRARSAAGGGRSISETLDRIVQAARQSESASAPARSAVGMVRLPDDDPDLASADADIRAWLGAYLPLDPGTARAPRPRRKTTSAARRRRG